MNMENFVSYSPVAHSIISHVLLFGVAAHLCGLVYFLATSDRTAPHYRLSSTISGVVMASAALLLLQLVISWRSAFTFNGQVWVPVENTCSATAGATSTGRSMCRCCLRSC